MSTHLRIFLESWHPNERQLLFTTRNGTPWDQNFNLPRPYTGLPDIDYPLHDKTIVVTHCGRICLGRKKTNFSQVFAGQAIGIKEVHDDIWLVSFMDYDLGYFDLETRVLEPLENPFGPKVLPMS
jgi:putative transposase